MDKDAWKVVNKSCELKIKRNKNISFTQKETRLSYLCSKYRQYLVFQYCCYLVGFCKNNIPFSVSRIFRPDTHFFL